MTIEEKIEFALFSRVRTLELTLPHDIVWPNNSFFPVFVIGDDSPQFVLGDDSPQFVLGASNGPHIRVQQLPNNNTRLLVKGSAPHMRQGILQLTIVDKLNLGPSNATKTAGEISEHFPADLALFKDGVKVRIQSAPDILQADKTDVSWNVPVSIRYEALV